MSIWDGAKGYYKLSGLRGLLAVSSFRIFGAPREIQVQPPGFKHPVHLRIRTSDISLFHDILMGGAYDIHLPGFLPQTIVDAGANVGMASVYYANRFPTARIIAVEPEPSNYTVLLKNVLPYPNIIPVNAALWNTDGEITLARGDPEAESFGNWAFYTCEGGNTKVRAITMPTLMEETNVRSIDLLKMDVEGAEKEIFERWDWFAQVQVMAIELHDHVKPGCSEAIRPATIGLQQWHSGDMTFVVRGSQ